MFSFTETSYENSIIELLEGLGYTHVYGPNVTRDVRSPLILDEVRLSLERINPDVPSAAIEEALYKIRNYEAGSLVSKNEVFTDYLQNGVSVTYQDKGDTKSNIL